VILLIRHFHLAFDTICLDYVLHNLAVCRLLTNQVVNNLPFGCPLLYSNAISA
jgi:hypothetical protein